jgi:hypothetical protein
MFSRIPGRGINGMNGERLQRPTNGYLYFNAVIPRMGIAAFSIIAQIFEYPVTSLQKCDVYRKFPTTNLIRDKLAARIIGIGRPRCRSPPTPISYASHKN